MAKRRPKKRRSSRRGRGGSGGGNVIWYVAIVVCLALIGGTVFLSQKLIAKGEIDQATLCHTSGPINVTAILLDLTDPLSETQQARLKTIMANEIASSSVDTMISLGVVSESAANWGARFAKCKPATGEAANGLYENPTIIAARYRHEFTDPIQVTLAGMLEGDVESQSPIMEALQSLISETPDFTRTSGVRKLMIVSDMLQHSDNLSFYRQQGWDFFMAQNGARRLAGNLADVEVEILRIPRTGGNLPSNELTEGFWTRYFDKQGSRAPRVRSLGDL